MRLSLPIEFAVAVPPLFFWEKNRRDLLRIRSAKSFHPHHVTTRLCMELLDETLRENPCARLLDVGCGSGILALAALSMGAAAATGVDISHRAIRESILNAEFNDLSTRASWVVASTHAIENTYPCVIANLRAEILSELLEELVRLTSPCDGALILSGFQDIDWPWLEPRCVELNMKTERLMSGDQSFYGIPPSGSFTWMAVRLARQNYK